MNDSSAESPTASPRFWSLALIVCILGYFVDIYDIVLFGVVRIPSLQAIGVPADAVKQVGLTLLNWQMGGMLVGGVLWGVMGDRRGRKAVLFSSILTYSLANIANAHVATVEQYAALRFIAGLGLAGELGAAVTLMSEITSPRLRGYATTLIAGIGVAGAVAANLVAKDVAPWLLARLPGLGLQHAWQVAYWVGGLMGLALLALRVSIRESRLFEETRRLSNRGSLRLLFGSWERVGRFTACVLIGMPTWFVVGILVSFAPEFARALGSPEASTITPGDALMWCYVGLIIGDLGSGFMSQWLGSRRKVVALFLTLTAALVLTYLSMQHPSRTTVLTLCGLLGVGVGYWAVFVTIAAEQFGTNLRATVATIVPNLARGALIPITFGYRALEPGLGSSLHAALAIGMATLVLGGVGVWMLRETFGKDLDFIER